MRSTLWLHPPLSHTWGDGRHTVYAVPTALHGHSGRPGERPAQPRYLQQLAALRRAAFERGAALARGRVLAEEPEGGRDGGCGGPCAVGSGHGTDTAPRPASARALLVVDLGAERGPADGEALAAGCAPQAVVAAEAQEPPAGQVGAAAL